MSIAFRILKKEEIDKIIPLVHKLNDGRVSTKDLEIRFSEMIHQNYECAVIEDSNEIIGVTGLWYCTRHYVGKTVEIDHVYIKENYRNKGVGDRFMKWIEGYVKTKNCGTIELNTYVENFPSHKFYYNQGFVLRGYHFLKKLNSI